MCAMAYLRSAEAGDAAGRARGRSDRVLLGPQHDRRTSGLSLARAPLGPGEHYDRNRIRIARRRSQSSRDGTPESKSSTPCCSVNNFGADSISQLSRAAAPAWCDATARSDEPAHRAARGIRHKPSRSPRSARDQPACPCFPPTPVTMSLRKCAPEPHSLSTGCGACRPGHRQCR
jgi:hypothetical protein